MQEAQKFIAEERERWAEVNPLDEHQD